MDKKKKNNTKYSLWFIAGGMFLSGTIFVGSLFALYSPAFAEKATASLVSLSNHIKANDNTEEPGDTDIPEDAGMGEAGSGNADDSVAFPSPEETDSIPFLEPPVEQGNISDLAQIDADNKTYFAMLDTALGPMLYYNQGDSRWGDYPYGGADPIKKYGCGPTAVAMLVNSFTANSVTPVNIADWSAANGYYAPQGGSYHSLIPEGLAAFGLRAESVKKHTYENAAELLSTGHVLVALMGKGSLTDNGHFILITKLLENGNVQIADPNSYENSTKEWDLTQLLAELKKTSDYGSPLWSVTSP